VDHNRKEKLAKYDRFFKTFEYTKALDAAMDVSLNGYFNISYKSVELISFFKKYYEC